MTQADFLDVAASETSDYVDRKVSNIRRAAQDIVTSNPDGTCLWCFADTDFNHRFCDVECRDAYQKENE